MKLKKMGIGLAFCLAMGLLLVPAPGCSRECLKNQRLVRDDHSGRFLCEDRDPKGGQPCDDWSKCQCVCEVQGTPEWLAPDRGPPAGQRVKGRCAHYPPRHSGVYCFVKNGVATYGPLIF